MDAYDLEVERLANATIEQMDDAWAHDTCGGEKLHSCLFDDCGIYRHSADTDMPCGCLTLVRCGSMDAQTPELTDAIRADERLPLQVDDITREHLPVFAEWQRRIDKELGRTPPPMPKVTP